MVNGCRHGGLTSEIQLAVYSQRAAGFSISGSWIAHLPFKPSSPAVIESMGVKSLLLTFDIIFLELSSFLPQFRVNRKLFADIPSWLDCRHHYQFHQQVSRFRSFPRQATWQYAPENWILRGLPMQS